MADEELNDDSTIIDDEEQMTTTTPTVVTPPTNLPVAIAQRIAEMILEKGITQELPTVDLLPWYDTTKDSGVKVFVLPSNITTDSRVAKDVVKQIFAVQVEIIKYIPDINLEYANDVLDIAEKLTVGMIKEDIVVNDVSLKVDAVVMYGASEVLWNGDWQINGLIKQHTLSEADVFSSSFVIIASRYLYV